MTSRHRTMSNQRLNNVVYVNGKHYNVEQRQIKIYVDINNVRKLYNSTVISIVEFHHVDQRRNNIVNMTIFKKSKRAKKTKAFELQNKDDSFD